MNEMYSEKICFFIIGYYSFTGLPDNDRIQKIKEDYMKAKDEIETLHREKDNVGYFLVSFHLKFSIR